MTITFQTSAFDSASNPVIHTKLAQWLMSGGYSNWSFCGANDVMDMVEGKTVDGMFDDFTSRFWNAEDCTTPPPWTYKEDSMSPSGKRPYLIQTVKVFQEFMLSVVHRGVPDNGSNPYYVLSLYYSNAVSEETRKQMHDFLASYFRKAPEPTTRGLVYMLMSEGKDYDFKQLPSQITGSLEEGNYTPEVLQGYHRILSDLGSANPAGRISIFDGPPGTGKTYLVRGMLTDCDSVAFVFVAPEQIIQLTGPSFLGKLIDFSRRVQKPIAFIVEDADAVIANRDSGNISYVANILNLGDGILGQMLDLRLVFTTNARSTDLDPAIVRPGRLSAHIHVGKLPAAQCNTIYKRLTGKDSEFTKDATLAEVYQKAINAGWTPSPTVKPQKRIGLGYDD